MAILKRVRQGTGDGAGRARYALQKAVAVRTDIPSPLSLLTDKLTEELKRELANEFNRQLLIHQKSYKTQHFIVSFSHHLTDKEIEAVLDKLEQIFDDSLRLHLFAVHREEHGTAIHIIESADPEGRLRHLSRKEFFDLKRAVIRELRSFLNKRELEVARNFSQGIVTQDWKHPIQLNAPERSFKEYIRKTVEEAAKLLKAGKLEEAIRLLKERGVEVKNYEAGQLSPLGRRLSRNRLYGIFMHPTKGLIATRVDKQMKATYNLYVNALKEYENGLKRAKQRANELSSEVTAVERGHRGTGKGKGLIEAGSLDIRRVEGIKERLERLGHELRRCERLLNELEKSSEQFENGVDELKDSVKQLENRSEELEKRIGRSKELHSGSSDLDGVEMDAVVDGNNGFSGSSSSYGAFGERDTDSEMGRGNLSRTVSGSEVEMPIPQEVIDEIKQIEPEKILGYLGIPFKRVGNRIMAQAVWRGEKEASVSIQYKDGKWLWYDFGAGEGGDWIDLYRRYIGSDFKEAVSTLMELSNVAYTPNERTREPNFGRERKTSTFSPAKPEFEEIEKIPLRELQEPPRDLAEYLELKGFLPYWEQIREIPELYYLRYRRGRKEYSGLAIKTLAGTWVVKTKTVEKGKEVFKTYVSQQPSGISFWRRDPSRVIVVEGFTDAMALAINPNFKDHSILILNGLGNLEKATEMLKILSPSELYIALDLDEKGIEGRRKLMDEFPEARHVYFYGKDPAEYLSDKYAREHFPPFCEDWITSPFAPYTQLLPMYFEGGYLNKEVLREFSYEAYEMYLELEFLDEEAERYAEEVSEFERYYLPESEEDEPEDRDISLDF